MTQLSVRIPDELLQKIHAITSSSKRTKSEVVVEVIELGLARKEEEELLAGFALLGDPEMQDMQFPTGAQKEVMGLEY